MTLRSARFSTRGIWLLMLAALAGVALWMFVPWDSVRGGQFGFDERGLPSSVKVDGRVQVEANGDQVTRLVVPLSLRGDDAITLTNASGKMRAETLLGETASAAVPATYDVYWPDGDGDALLEPGEEAELVVTLPDRSNIHPGNPLRLVIRPVSGDALIIYNVLGD